MKASCVLLTHNGWPTTRQCLESMERCPPPEGTDVIVVDNASTDGTREGLVAWSAAGPGRTIILNARNEGFAAGMNRGIGAATGEVVVLMNNDLVVTPGWLQGLLPVFAKDASVGLVGPVTNRSWNLQMVAVGYKEVDDLDAWAAAHGELFSGETFDLPMLGFFCVAIHRRVIESVGLLDERFGQGFFEDDDYCLRARRAGFRLVVAEGVFVHHHQGHAFGRVDPDANRLLWWRNRRRWERKWATRWRSPQDIAGALARVEATAEAAARLLPSDPPAALREVQRLRARSAAAAILAKTVTANLATYYDRLPLFHHPAIEAARTLGRRAARVLGRHR